MNGGWGEGRVDGFQQPYRILNGGREGQVQQLCHIKGGSTKSSVIAQYSFNMGGGGGVYGLDGLSHGGGLLNILSPISTNVTRYVNTAYDGFILPTN